MTIVAGKPECYNNYHAGGEAKCLKHKRTIILNVSHFNGAAGDAHSITILTPQLLSMIACSAFSVTYL